MIPFDDIEDFVLDFFEDKVVLSALIGHYLGSSEIDVVEPLHRSVKYYVKFMWEKYIDSNPPENIISDITIEEDLLRRACKAQGYEYKKARNIMDKIVIDIDLSQKDWRGE